MVVSRASFLASLLHRFPNTHIRGGVTALPKKEQEVFSEPAPKEVLELEHLFEGYHRLSGWLHDSWLEELLAPLPVSVRSALLYKKEEPISEALKKFLLEYALFHSTFTKVEDLSAHTTSPVAWLLQLSSKGIEEVLQLLSLFPLVEPFLHILDKPRLQKLAYLLTAQQKKFLSYLLLVSRPGPFDSIDIGDLLANNGRGQAKNILLEKGICIFASALYGEKEALILRICYKVDKELGKRLYSEWQQEQQKPEKPKAPMVALDIVHTFMKGRK